MTHVLARRSNQSEGNHTSPQFDALQLDFTEVQTITRGDGAAADVVEYEVELELAEARKLAWLRETDHAALMREIEASS